MIIKTAKGKEFQTDYVVKHNPSSSVYIRIIGETSGTVGSVFGDESETAILTYGNNQLVGYTKLGGIYDEGDALKVRLSIG